MAIGGLDIGSSGAKITVVSRDGATLHTGYRTYSASQHIETHEIDAASLWQAVQQLLCEAAKQVPDMIGLGITSFGESFVLCGQDGEPLLPVMMYTDPRGSEQSHQLTATLGAERIYEISGCTPHPMYSLPKFMWIKQHQPVIYAKAKYCFLIGDYILYKLTGRRCIDYSLAARTMALDIRTLTWSGDLLDAAGIDASLFSELVPSGAEAGTIDPSLAAELGLPKHLRIVLCGHDQVAAAVGSNCMTPGSSANGAGTVECVTPIFQGVPTNPAMRRGHYSIVPFVKPGLYCTYSFSFTAGSLMRWVLSHLAKQEAQQAAARGISVFEQLESEANDEPSGILLLPHFAGAATPYMDTGSKGAILGLELTHTLGDLYRAAMEGIVYEMKMNLDTLAEGGVRVVSLNASGGGAKSRRWLQMKADILGLPVTKLSLDEAGTVGGIMMTGAATGQYNSLEHAAQTLVRPLETYIPRPAMHEKYAVHYRRYRNVYNTVRPLFTESRWTKRKKGV